MSRVLLTILSTVFVALSVLYIQSTALSQQALSEQANLRLTAISSSRAAELSRYLGLLESELRLYSNSPMTKNALQDLQSAYAKLSSPQEQLQFAYIDNNPHQAGQLQNLFRGEGSDDYHLVHENYHGYFRLWLELGELYDVFLIDPDGNLIYSVVKERDYATNLFDGPWKNSGLADVARQTAQSRIPNALAISDFEAYGPSNNDPASFAAMPVFKEGKYAGALAIQLPINSIESILSQYDGLGETGEVYLVGANGKMLSNSRFSESSTILRQRVDSDSVRLAIAGESGIRQGNNYLDQAVLSSFQPFKPFPSASNHFGNWALIAEINLSEVNQPTNLLISRMTLLGAVILVGASLLGIWEARAISKPIKQMQLALTDLSKGKQTMIPGHNRRDEIGKMAKAAEEFRLQSEEIRLRQNQQARITGITQMLAGIDDFDEAPRQITRYFCQEFGAPLAAFYLKVDNQLKLVASIGINRQSATATELALADSLAGQSLLEQRGLHISPVPDNHVELSAGMASGKLQQISFHPIRHLDHDVAVLELGFCERVDDQSISDQAELAQYLGLLLSNLKTNQENRSLLAESQALAKHLQSQQDALNDANAELTSHTEELKAQTEELRAKEDELNKKNQSLKQQRTALEAANKDAESKAQALEQASRYKSEFLANMSHELRTPLNSILILAEDLAAQSSLAPDQLEAAQVIHQSGSSLLQLINDILDLSKIESGKLATHIEGFSVQKTCHYLQRVFQPLADQRSNQLIIHSPSTNEPFFSDEQRVQQVITNLLSNAIKFTEHGKVELTIEQNEEQLRVTVSDTGVGIATDKLDHIFGAFQQEDGSTSRRFGGTGLGLSISKHLAQMLGGDITVRSKVGQGSTFNAHFANQPTHIPAPKSEPSAARQTINNLEQQHILLLEDNPQIAMTVEAIMQNEALTYQTFAKGSDGLEALKNQPFSAVILDLNLEDMDGLSFVNQVEEQALHLPPTIIFSADDIPKEQYLRLREFSDTFVLKTPEGLSRLRDELLRLLEQPEPIDTEANIPVIRNRLLLVDDDVRNLFALSKVLRKRGYEVTLADSADKAMNLLASNTFDVVITDIMMPQVDGYELTRNIRAIYGAQIPIIALTAKAMQGDKQLCIEAGANEYLTKPVDIDLLTEAIQSC
ncbi:response regulator [Salinibius halmophilus]|uniref:response regulator n=1 Tax=Salinibius halmophilus TaxID=1853216 RepID=UPI000E6633B3|nr:response regulator [Salinibius halmophilus]